MMFPLPITETITLRPLVADNADEMLALITRNRAHLDRWLRWSGTVTTRDETLAIIEAAQARLRAGNGFHAGMWRTDGESEQLIGGVVCHYINRISRKTEIGYWLDAQHTGQGIVTAACRAVMTRLFEDEDMHRIELQAAVDNVKSRAVAERLGFVFEGVKRESEWITDQFRDHAVYSVLAREWQG